MLDVAVYNVRQHRQFPLESGTLMLARAGDETPVWVPVGSEHADLANAVVKISHQGRGLTLAISGCEGECYCGKKCCLASNCQFELPARFSIGETQFEIVETAPADVTKPARALQRLHATAGASLSTGTASSVNGPAPATLSKWFATVGELNHWATSLQELYVSAARGAVEAIGLDGAIVLRRRDGEWEVAASYLPQPELGIHFDLRLLGELLISPETMFHGSDRDEDRETGTQVDKENRVIEAPSAPAPAVVISPLRNAIGDVAGAIYGFRSVRSGNGRRGIRYLEANLIELLANAVSEGIARLGRELEVDQHRALLSQSLAASLSSDRNCNVSEQREVTLLFADLRDFTRLANNLSPDEVYELLGQVMDCLTSAVMDLDGVVIDYFGDGLAAMWNAPADQAEHSELACRAAVRMLKTLPDVAADWTDFIASAAQLRLGVGVHTGIVQVGNAGSRRRAKYGPRGANVHLAARIEAATKCLDQPLLVSGATARRLSTRFTTARICRAALAGIDEPADLYAVWSREAADASVTPNDYSRALALFESGDLDSAAQLLRQIDPATTRLPVEFLANHIEGLIARRYRRSGDRSPGPFRGVITLNVK